MTTVPLPPDAAELEVRAQAEAAAGNLRTAADIYRDLAEQSVMARRAGYLIDGAVLLIGLGDTSLARQWLGEAGASANPEQQKIVAGPACPG